MALHGHKPTGIPAVRIALRGEAILTNLRFNKGMGFTAKERIDFKLTGRLPYRTNSLDEQCYRAYEQLKTRDEPLRKNTFLQSLKDQNWTLYYALLARHLKELVPIIYTPTEVINNSEFDVDFLTLQHRPMRSQTTLTSSDEVRDYILRSRIKTPWKRIFLIKPEGET